MAQSADCLVLGAGSVGVATALHLQARGREVVLVDRRPAGEATSFGNAGLIQAEGVVPYMLPRDPLLLARMLANQRPEAHVHYRALLALMPWLARYMWNSMPKGVERGAAAHLPLIRNCVAEHDALMEAAGATDLARRTGYLRIFRDTADLEADEAEHKRLNDRYGVNYEVLNPDRLKEIEPHLSQDLVGAIYLTDPVSVSDPSALAKSYADLFVARGGRFATADATTLESAGGKWQVQTVDGPIMAKDAVVAAGPWSGDILKAQGVPVPLAVKRGYHMHYKPAGNAGLTRPVIETDYGYALAPMKSGIRLTTGAEFAFRDAPATPKQLAKVEPAARKLIPLDNRIDPKPWIGARPCLPDLIPMIGPVPRRPGLWANFGHHHLGLTLGPVTGRLLAEMMTGEKPFTAPEPYRVDRF